MWWCYSAFMCSRNASFLAELVLCSFSVSLCSEVAIQIYFTEPIHVQNSKILQMRVFHILPSIPDLKTAVIITTQQFVEFYYVRYHAQCLHIFLLKKDLVTSNCE